MSDFMSDRIKTVRIKINISKPINYKFEHQGRLVDMIDLAVDALKSYKKKLEKF